MSVIKYIGRTNYFKGKTLWEIVGNLKDYGVGRVVVRSVFERYPEKSFMRIVKVEADPYNIIYINQNGIDVPQNLRKVKVWVESVFRGRRIPGTVLIHRTSYKADYRLIPKDEEEEYCKITKAVEERVVPQYMEYPPLLKELVLREYAKNGETPPEKMVLPLKLKKSSRNVYKKTDDESQVFPLNVGKPVSPLLYSDLPLSG